MGNNLDLVALLGLPEKTNCPRCRKSIKTNFDDYDIECGTPQASENDGFLLLDCCCGECDNDFQLAVQCKVI